MKRTKLGDLNFAYTDEVTSTAGDDVLVLLHGFPLNQEMWKHQVSELSKTHRVIVPDLRGHGGTEVTKGTVTMAEMAQDVAALMDHLEITTPMSLGGLSMGGYVAFEFYSQFPDRVNKLLLFDTRAVADTETVARARKMMAAQVVVSGASMAADAMLPKLVSQSTKDEQPEIVAELQDVILSTDPEAIAATQRGMAERRDMTAQLSSMDIPTLVLCGSEDTISPPDEMRSIANAMPNAQFVEIANAGHLAPLEQPGPVNEAVCSFLAK